MPDVTEPQDHDRLLTAVAAYYSGKLKAHGETPQGVDWNNTESQTLRFEQLCKIVTKEKGAISVNDLGCGYGALYDYMAERFDLSTYTGIDVSTEMIAAARQRLEVRPGTTIRCVHSLDVVADYTIASGIFNVRLGHNAEEWNSYMQATLDEMARFSRKGVAFNCLTTWSDAERMRADLHYADPAQLFDLCKLRYARNVSLLHDYNLYEFTILIRMAP